MNKTADQSGICTGLQYTLGNLTSAIEHSDSPEKMTKHKTIKNAKRLVGEFNVSYTGKGVGMRPN